MLVKVPRFSILHIQDFYLFFFKEIRIKYKYELKILFWLQAAGINSETFGFLKAAG